jgi:hypothetical protein
MLTIFVALKCFGALTHRELMELVVKVQESGIISQIEGISKTKIRAVFCMLKNSRAMITADGEGESVRIQFGKGISTFRQFRERQDSFINKCCTLQQIFIPYELKGDLIWQLDPVTMQLRVEELKRLEAIVREFLCNEVSNLPRNKTGIPSERHHFQSNSRLLYTQPSAFPSSMSPPYSIGNHAAISHQQYSLPVPPYTDIPTHDHLINREDLFSARSRPSFDRTSLEYKNLSHDFSGSWGFSSQPSPMSSLEIPKYSTNTQLAAPPHMSLESNNSLSWMKSGDEK